MIDLLPLLENATKKMRESMTQWFAGYPPGMPWTIVSDYCIGDKEKNNDVFSFVVIANHDKTENIIKYISAAVPRDLKKVQSAPLGLIQYLTCPQPITFSVSFVIDQESSLLRDYLRVEDMVDFIPDSSETIEIFRNNSHASSSVDPKYFDEALQRLRVFGKDLTRKQPNARLSRQIHLAAAFAAIMFSLVTESTGAGYIRWISDRDKLIEHNDTVVYDLAYFYFALMASNRPGLTRDAEGHIRVEIPKIMFELPDKTGKNRFDALIRLPDYLAGTLADMAPDLSCSREKFCEIVDSVFVDSTTNCVVQLSSNGERITIRNASLRTEQ
ncbi:hypothetical protein [Comamonas sp. UBA7528]|uniref:hypothetical protein n=1 Tax=Comamonas sp. UBA7528 TaxID=1946391 RepID=UPI0025BF8BED|nr:hypothetical protein [Comamonas sp. UBA7528]